MVRNYFRWLNLITLNLVVTIGLLFLFCGEKSKTTGKKNQTIQKEGVMEEMTLKSEAFAEGAFIPKKYSCEGPDVSPPLEWSTPPAGTGLSMVFHPIETVYPKMSPKKK